jgi:hypothetical protein
MASSPKRRFHQTRGARSLVALSLAALAWLFGPHFFRQSRASDLCLTSRAVDG